MTEQYELRQDGSLIGWMQWPDEGLSVNIDGLSLGTYRYQLTAIIGNPWVNTYSNQVRVDVVTGIPGEGSNPSMKYYLRKYSVQTYIQGNFTLPLQILVKDTDGIEEVILIHSFDDGPWSNLSMNERSEDSE
jgi:hypothetical protein